MHAKSGRGKSQGASMHPKVVTKSPLENGWKLELENGVVLGGAWKSKEEEFRRAKFKMQCDEEKYRALSECWLMAMEETHSKHFQAQSALVQQEVAESKSEQLEIEVVKERAKNDLLTNRLHDSNVELEQWKCKNEEAVALIEQIRIVVQTLEQQNEELQQRLSVEVSEARKFRDLYFQEQVTTERLSGEVEELEAKRTVLETVRTQKDRQLFLALKEKNSLFQEVQVLLAEKKRPGPLLRRPAHAEEGPAAGQGGQGGGPSLSRRARTLALGGGHSAPGGSKGAPGGGEARGEEAPPREPLAELLGPQNAAASSSHEGEGADADAQFLIRGLAGQAARERAARRAAEARLAAAEREVAGLRARLRNSNQPRRGATIKK